MKPWTAAQKRYRYDRMTFWMFWGALSLFGILSAVSFDPFDFVSTSLGKYLAFVTLVLSAASWFKSTVRKVVQEELSAAGLIDLDAE